MNRASVAVLTSEDCLVPLPDLSKDERRQLVLSALDKLVATIYVMRTQIANGQIDPPVDVCHVMLAHIEDYGWVFDIDMSCLDALPH